MRPCIGLPWLSGVAIAWLAVVNMPAQEAFVRFTEVSPSSAGAFTPGNSTDSQFNGANGWRRLLALSHGTLNPVTVNPGGLAPDTAVSDILMLETPIDAVSPGLFRACALGAHFDGVEVAVRDAGAASGAARPFFAFKLKLAFVKEVSWRGSPDGVIEHLEIVYGMDQVTGRKMDAAGNVVSDSIVRWDFTENIGGVGPFSTTNKPVLTYPENQKVGLGDKLTIAPASGPMAFDPLLPLTIVNLGGYTGGASVDAISGVLSLDQAGPLGGPYNLTVRARDIFGVSTDTAATVAVNARPQFTRIDKVGNNLVLQLGGLTNSSYQIQFANTPAGGWTNVGAPLTVGATGQPAPFTNALTPNPRFFRAVEAP